MKSRQASAASTSTSAVAAASRAAVDRFARAQQRLRGDAGPVRALAADELALDEGDAQAAFAQRAGAVLAGRAAADHDRVVVAAHQLAALDLSSAPRLRGLVRVCSRARGRRCRRRRSPTSGASGAVASYGP